MTITESRRPTRNGPVALTRDLEEAVAAGNIQEAGRLLVRVNATARHERTEAENAVADGAAQCMTAVARQRQAEATARRAEQEEIRAQKAVGRVEELLAALERSQPPKTLRKLPAQQPGSASKGPRG
ncbi:hypothetical protein [Streptomyces sp. NPDC097610]|uniref:hypothetical protein n=1 Tax=Streptomyces sp. NPDC097610 TaxID=3157227 RepID=UPI0033189212